MISVLSALATLDADFAAFEAKHGRRYASEAEREYRRAAFAENAAFVAAHNSVSSAPYTLALNHWADRTAAELGLRPRPEPGAPASLLQAAEGAALPERLRNRKRRGRRRKRVRITPGANRDFRERSRADAEPEVPPLRFVLPPHASAPAAVDWRDKGMVSGPRNQGECGACYAIVTAGAVEAAAAIGSGAALVPLSPQSIVDCSGNASVGASARDAGNHGCVGGGIVRGFNYALRNGGVATEEAYPDRLEENAPGNCSYARADVAGRISGYVNVSANATLLRYAVAQNPVATAVDAHHRSFLFYESGVYRSAECTQEVTHGVLVVGYGTDDDGTPYFVLKNSWSEFWGDDGYMRIAATPEGMCGLGSEAYFPVL